MAIVLGAFAAMPAASQNPGATPTYGDVELISPIGAEPYEVRLQAGGPIKAREILPGDCRGHIASAPDFDLHYQAGAMPLYIYVESDTDTTLAVNAPEGAWHCSDDHNGLNPAVMFEAPESGHYTIWVGTYRDSGNERAVLIISETGMD